MLKHFTEKNLRRPCCPKSSNKLPIITSTTMQQNKIFALQASVVQTSHTSALKRAMLMTAQ
jgi:hypothetical protein